MKHRLKQIKILWSESSEIKDGATFTDIDVCNSRLYKASLKAPTNGAYDKTKFEITFEDGETYVGRIDLHHPSYEARSWDLEKHVKDFLNQYGHAEFLETYSLR